MKTLLIVDDDTLFIEGLGRGLARRIADLHVETAANGAEALDVFATTGVDLLLTDLQMPVMDGFALLAWITRERPHVPAIVMTAFGGGETEQRLHALGVGGYVQKPLDFDALTVRVAEVLAVPPPGHGHGVTLTRFLHVLALEAKTCTLDCESQGRRGRLALEAGRLAGAWTEGVEGRPAALEMLTWPEVAITIAEGRPPEATLRVPMEAVLLESSHRHDEARRRSAGAGVAD